MKPRDFENPWSNPVGEILYPLIATALRFVPKLYVSPPLEAEESQPDPPYESLRFCKECGEATPHREFFWRIEDETTIECSACGGIWAVG